MTEATIVYTIGHSTRSLESFIGILKEYSLSKVVDVRTIPRSRHVPQFNQETLPNDLQRIEVSYVHLSGLGGLRHARKDSLNVGWRNASFRGFADYMQTPEFEKSLLELVNMIGRERLVVMCAEAVPWKCHRFLISDALLVRGIRAQHIVQSGKLLIHTLTPFAKVDGLRITYPAKITAEKTQYTKQTKLPESRTTMR